ncbi:HD domain-containing protein [Acidaminobacter sp. JC074]|uniref:HD domain-containing protein n=1 Tax=Acidaminobacter sp. JC074 TaxID=2530199 RepID=UPI00216FBFCD|nr:HD domain-containing protein [Acidaminobacter sp. JC074]
MADKKVVVIGCLLHDLGKFECEENVDHGRLSAAFAKPFLQTLDLTEKEIADICFSIASHVDGKAGYEYEDILEAKIVTDADNIDRFSSSKILMSKLWSIRDGKRAPASEVQYLEKRIKRMREMINQDVLETDSGNALFKEKLKLSIHFYHTLIEDLKITHEPVWL